MFLTLAMHVDVDHDKVLLLLRARPLSSTRNKEPTDPFKTETSAIVHTLPKVNKETTIKGESLKYYYLEM